MGRGEGGSVRQGAGGAGGRDVPDGVLPGGAAAAADGAGAESGGVLRAAGRGSGAVFDAEFAGVSAKPAIWDGAGG